MVSLSSLSLLDPQDLALDRLRVAWPPRLFRDGTHVVVVEVVLVLVDDVVVVVVDDVVCVHWWC